MENRNISYGMFLVEKSSQMINLTQKLRKSIEEFFVVFTDSISDGVCLCRIIQNYGSSIIKLSNGNHFKQQWSIQTGEFMNECSQEIEKFCEKMLQESNIDIADLFAFYESFVNTNLHMLKEDANKLESLESIFTKKNYKYEKRSKEIQGYVRYYNESENNANSIYNLSQMNRNFEKIESGITSLIKFESELEELVRNIKDLRVNTGNSYLDLCESFFAFFTEFFEKIRVLVQAYLKKIIDLLMSVQNLFSTKMTLVLLAEIYPCYPKLDDNEKSTNNDSKWPYYLEDPEAIPDSLLFKYSDLTQAYVEKVLAMVEERIEVMKKLKCYFTETSNYFEKLSNGLERKNVMIKVPYIDVLSKKLLSFSYLCNTIALEAQALVSELQKGSKIAWGEVSKILKQYWTMSRDVLNKKLDPNNIPIKYRNKLKAGIRDLSHVAKEVLHSFIIEECKMCRKFKNKIEGMMFQSEQNIKDLSSIFENSLNAFSIPDLDEIIPDEIKLAFSKGYQEIIVAEKEKEISIERFFDTQKISLKKFEHLRHPDINFPIKLETSELDSEEKNTTIHNQEFSFRDNFNLSIVKKNSNDTSPNKRGRAKTGSTIILEDQESIMDSYSCALQDKLVLHGKLQITNMKLYFHSYFNRDNLFFGETKMVIPKTDILRIEKKTNVLIFDNSIQIITTRGKVFFTSFLNRDKAYNSIINALKPPEQPELLNAEADEGKEEETGFLAYEEIEKLRNSKFILDPSSSFRQESFMKYLFKTPCDLIEVYSIILSGNPIKIESKDYSSFWEYLRVIKTLDTEFKEEPWSTKVDYKGNPLEMPESLTKEITYIHPVKKQIPFMPKTCPVVEKHRLFFTSEKEIVLEIDFKTSKVPYADSFYMVFRYVFLQVAPQRIEIRFCLKHVWLKSTIMQGTIEKESMKEATDTTKTIIFSMMDEVLKSMLGREFVTGKTSGENQKENSEKEIESVQTNEMSKFQRHLKAVKEFDYKSLIKPMAIILATLLVIWIIISALKYVSNLQKKMDLLQEVLLEMKRNEIGGKNKTQS